MLNIIFDEVILASDKAKSADIAPLYRAFSTQYEGKRGRHKMFGLMYPITSVEAQIFDA